MLANHNMRKRKLDPRLYDDEWSELERKARRDLIRLVCLAAGLVALIQLARYALG